jgi:hypothetical protein
MAPIIRNSSIHIGPLGGPPIPAVLVHHGASNSFDERFQLAGR